MAAQATHFLEQANWLAAMDTIVWDSGWILSDTSLVGRALHTLIGYTDQPTAMQLAVYLAILLVTFVLMRLYGSPAKATPAPAQSCEAGSVRRDVDSDQLCFPHFAVQQSVSLSL